jgi:HPt (histidine-containing phosphotransfer) domain-containing protein
VTVATSSILNIEELLTRVDDDRGLLVELFFIFKSVFPANFQRLSDAVQLEEAKNIQIEGHTLKGMLLNLAAHRAAAAAGELEQRGCDSQFSGMKEALAELQSEVDILLSAMDERTSEFTP